ncbi:protein MAIN-LIKE [Trifolium repens]|nr:protein MAIN-LIKE [Trifolium repens]
MVEIQWEVARTRGRDGRIIHRQPNREDNRDRQEQQPVGWPGGPIDVSLLTRYEHHVSRYIWLGQERLDREKPGLRIASLGDKLSSWVPDQHPPIIQTWLNNTGLCWLERTSLKKCDPSLLSAFVERWYPETSSFHMPFGEMTITLDDVACLLHLSVRGQLFTPRSYTMEEAAALAAELLGVTYDIALQETAIQRGGYFGQQWLYHCYQRNVHLYQRYDCAARAYMLMLVGCTIFADKSYTRVDAKWLPMFRNLETLHTFSWASAALVCLYDNLNDASMFSTKALAGYATLLQCWIHEHFPSLGRRADARSSINCDDPGYPYAMRWIYKQGKMKLPDYRPIMDALTPSDVIWRPFESHRGSIPFDLHTMYSGYLRGCAVVPYLPERCFRQFGYLQCIPPPPPASAPAIADIDSDWTDYDISVDHMLMLTRPVRFDGEATDDYLPWFYTVSHPRLCRPVDGPHGAPPAPQYAAPAPHHAPQQDESVAAEAQQGDQERLDIISAALHRFIIQIDVARGDEAFHDLYLAYDLARGADGADID